MVFFHVGSDVSSSSSSSTKLDVSSQWWLYIAVTLPLTIFVMGSWLIWLQWRMRTSASMKRDGDEQREVEGMKIQEGGDQQQQQQQQQKQR
jgi:hypothetical protein